VPASNKKIAITLKKRNENSNCPRKRDKTTDGQTL
jgi:hypothetical protein